MKQEKDIQNAFSMMMSRKDPDAQAFEDDYNQLAKNVKILGSYIPGKTKVSPFPTFSPRFFFSTSVYFEWFKPDYSTSSV